jgi:hypothetical protein
MKYYGDVNYEEGDQSTYEELILTNRETEEKTRFHTGNIVIDYINVVKFLGEMEAGCIWSSSIDHFFMDGTKYDRLYVNHDNKVLTGEWTEEYEKCIGYFVPIKENITSFEELRAYYKKHKIQ